MDKHFHVIKDPVHGTMQFDADENAWIKPVIDHPNFQRLRHIKQLGLGDLIFPGALHSRFNHSLGCCYVASQIARKLGLSDEERRSVILSGLLHDIGHGPFSHAFEGLFVHHPVRHEEWTSQFLTEFSGESLELCNAMIRHKTTATPLLSDIVSSQLDADRLDYLLRDSHFCGVTYGEYDLRWMLHALTRVNTPQGERLGITHKGIGVVEHYLNARRLMMHNIYHHPKKLALEYWLVQWLLQLSVAIQNDFPEIRGSKLGEFLLSVNQFNTATHAKKELFIQQQFPLYKTLCDYDIYAAMRHLIEKNIPHEVTTLAEHVYLRKLPKVFSIHPKNKTILRNRIAECITHHHFSPWQLALIDAPHQSYTGGVDSIFVDNHGVTEKLGSLSMMIHALSDKEESSCFLLVDRALLNHTTIQQLVKEKG